jgi:hypothetical protein
MDVRFCSARIICIQRTYELQGEANEVSFSRLKLQLSTVIVNTRGALSQEIQYVWRGWDIKRIQKQTTEAS